MWIVQESRSFFYFFGKYVFLFNLAIHAKFPGFRLFQKQTLITLRISNWRISLAAIHISFPPISFPIILRKPLLRKRINEDVCLT